MTNTGTENPSTEKPMTTRSSQVPWRYAATTPSGTEITIDSAIVSVASERVGPTRSAISSATCFL